MNSKHAQATSGRKWEWHTAVERVMDLSHEQEASLDPHTISAEDTTIISHGRGGITRKVTRAASVAVLLAILVWAIPVYCYVTTVNMGPLPSPSGAAARIPAANWQAGQSAAIQATLIGAAVIAVLTTVVLAAKAAGGQRPRTLIVYAVSMLLVEGLWMAASMCTAAAVLNAVWTSHA